MALILTKETDTKSQALKASPKTEPAKVNSNILLTETEAASFLTVSKALLSADRWSAKQAGVPPKFPYFKFGGCIRNKLCDLEALIEKSRIG